jgi:hypothetical protein
MADYVYVKDQELSTMQFAWYDANNALLDLSTGYTFTVKLATRDAPTTIVLSKTAGITGAATSPNLTIDWATTDFTSLTAAGTTYVVWIYARRTADSKDRVFNPANLPTLMLLTAPA